MRIIFTALLAITLILPTMALAGDSQGEMVVKKLWQDIKAANSTVMEGWLAQGFQAVHYYGGTGRAAEIELLKKVNLGDYKLTDFTTTQDGPVMVVNYRVSTAQTIDGKRVHPKGAPRMSVFLKTGKGWKWMAHANLNPPK